MGPHTRHPGGGSETNGGDQPVLAAVRRGGTRRSDRHPLGVPRRAGRGDRHRPAYDDACGPRRRSQCPMSTSEWSGKGWTITVTDTEMALAQASGPSWPTGQVSPSPLRVPLLAFGSVRVEVLARVYSYLDGELEETEIGIG